MAAPDDTALTETTVYAPGLGTGRTLILGCGALARELLALRRLNGWTHVDIRTLPAILHNRPERIPDAVRTAVIEARGAYDRVLVAYADCGTGGRLAAVCDDLGIEMLPGAHCYAVFDGAAAFADRAEAEIGAFYLTDFLARQFDAFVWRPLGLDRRPSLRDAYFGHYDRLVYLAQTEDPVLTTAAREAAERLGLAFERRATGYGDLAPWLAARA